MSSPPSLAGARAAPASRLTVGTFPVLCTAQVRERQSSGGKDRHAMRFCLPDAFRLGEPRRKYRKTPRNRRSNRVLVGARRELKCSAHVLKSIAYGVNAALSPEFGDEIEQVADAAAPARPCRTVILNDERHRLKFIEQFIGHVLRSRVLVKAAHLAHPPVDGATIPVNDEHTKAA